MTKANIRVIRENRPQAPLSAGSAEAALAISRHETAVASAIALVLPALTTPGRYLTVVAIYVYFYLFTPCLLLSTVSADS